MVGETEANPAEGMRPDGKPAQEVQPVESESAPEGRAMEWRYWGMALGVVVALVTLYGAVVAPARDSARTDAELRGAIDRNTADIADLRLQVRTDRETASQRYESLRDRIDAGARDTAALARSMTAVEGKLGVLLERVRR